MKATFRLSNTDTIEATASITMTIAEWEKLYEQLLAAMSSGYKQPLNDMIDLSRKVYS